jgi:hemoglobin/transferrin/lactoferrin receptor protein
MMNITDALKIQQLCLVQKNWTIKTTLGGKMFSNLKKKLISATCCCLLLLAPQAVWAASLDEQKTAAKNNETENVYELAPISVTATRTDRNLMEVPVSVSVVDEEEIERNPQDSVADLLKNIPGIYTQETTGYIGSTNFSSIRNYITIRGYDQSDTIVLIDGVQQSFPAQINASNVSAVDPMEIESIEVLKGAASVLYGSDGLGGVIKITTKKGGKKAFGTNVKTLYSTADNSFTPYASVYGNIKRFYYRVSTTGADKGDRYIYNHEKLRNSGSSFESYSARMGYEWDKAEINFSADALNEWSDLVDTMYDNDGYVVPTPEEDITSESRRRYDRNTYTLSYVLREITDNLDKVTVNGSWQKLGDGWITDDLTANAESYNADEENTSYSSSIQTDWTFFKDHAVSFGLDYRNDDVGIYVVQPTRVRDYTAAQETVALFIQDEWKPFKNFMIQPGLRQTWVSIDFDTNSDNTGSEQTGSRDYSNLVSSLGTVYTGVKDLAIRANFSQGYKIPSITSLYGGSTRILSNPGLEPEKSENYEIGLRYDNGKLSSDVAFFYGTFKDAITYVQVDTSVWEQTNANKKESYGAEFYSGYRIGHTGLTPYINLTAMTQELTYANGYETTDIGSPELWGKAGVKWDHFFSEKCIFFCDLGVRYTDAYQTRSSSTGEISYTYKKRKSIDFSFGFNGESSLGKYNIAVNLENITDENYKNELSSGFLATVSAGLAF